MNILIRIWLAAAVFAGVSGAPSQAAETIRLAVQKTGTFAWELAVIRAHELDKKASLALQVNELASPEAGKIALRGGAADAATLRAYRDRYREGIPRRPIADEEADARVLYRVLAAIGGSEIVGRARELDPGTFYRAIPGD